MSQPTMLAAGAVLLPVTAVVGPGEAFQNYATKSTFQATGRVQSGAGAAVVRIEVSNDELAWIEAGTMSLSLSSTGYETCGFLMEAPWRFVRANVVSISGTNAWVTVNMGA